MCCTAEYVLLYRITAVTVGYYMIVLIRVVHSLQRLAIFMMIDHIPPMLLLRS